jgi:nucleoid-associated protein YgaU
MSPPNPLKARLYVVAQPQQSVEFLYNPTSYSVSKSTTWHKPPATKGAKEAPAPEFGGANAAQVQMELFLDRWEEPLGDVSKDVRKLLRWLRATDHSHSNQQPQPPVLAFSWGRSNPLGWFSGYLKSVNAKYTMFREEGTPTRATVSISLEEVPAEPGRQNPSSGGLLGHRTRLMTAGDSLHSIAHEEYGDPSLWRALAELNGIDDPLRIPVGTTLMLASAADVAGGNGHRPVDKDHA